MNEAKELWAVDGTRLNMLERAVKAAVKHGLLAEHVSQEDYLRNWQGMIAILEELGVIEMYEALDMMYGAFNIPDDGCQDSGLENYFRAPVKAMRAALAKARGES